MPNVGQKYRCNIYGNEVEVTKARGGSAGLLREADGVRGVTLAGALVYLRNGILPKFVYFR